MINVDRATLIGLVLSALFIMIVIIVTATRKAPILMGNSLVCLSLALLFFFTEHSDWGYWHRYRESENRFWCLVAMLFATGVLFASDSPAQIGDRYPRLAMTLIFIFVLYVNHWERSLARRALGSRVRLRQQMATRFPSAIFSPDLVDSAREKLRKVTENLRKLDYRFAALKTWNQQDILRRERRIVGILSSASSDELNYILTNVNLPLLFYKIKDNDLLTPARLLARGRSSRRSIRASNSGLPLDLSNLNRPPPTTPMSTPGEHIPSSKRPPFPIAGSMPPKHSKSNNIIHHSSSSSNGANPNESSTKSTPHNTYYRNPFPSSFLHMPQDEDPRDLQATNFDHQHHTPSQTHQMTAHHSPQTSLFYDPPGANTPEISPMMMPVVHKNDLKMEALALSCRAVPDGSNTNRSVSFERPVPDSKHRTNLQLPSPLARKSTLLASINKARSTYSKNRKEKEKKANGAGASKHRYSNEGANSPTYVTTPRPSLDQDSNAAAKGECKHQSSSSSVSVMSSIGKDIDEMKGEDGKEVG
eukprot:CAMPEP_0184496344 /NCGR_PEP_ID=MMETSP0113_2-20130426/33712_1 /TAXON_ID=91329 /ORGANISM="Norrisiella sphaerica, Strain BC52" /LENGTH=531 /DNA_ID=CAMNT_0026882925 /DNA_START=47 /DNA_END=1638 /DNA_ORIENTATION=+